MIQPVIASEQPRPAAIPDPHQLITQSAPFAARVYAAVAEQYLEFRRIYYHEDHPSLATTPPNHAEIHQAQLARLADSTLRLLPQAIKSVPLVGGFIDHLENVANIHSMSERERTQLHNTAMGFLHGVKDGIQPWYVAWLLDAARSLAQMRHEEYYLAFPWDGLLYCAPDELAAFEEAVRRGDMTGIEAHIERLANRLIAALRDPIGVQPELAFTGPGAAERKRLFHVKTTAALALGATLVVEEVRLLLHPPHPAPQQSALPPLPAELAAHMRSER